jgi:hypothetical protein
VGYGKVEIQKQDFHFPTAPTACGSKEKDSFDKDLALSGCQPRGHFYRGKRGDISKEA